MFRNFDFRLFPEPRNAMDAVGNGVALLDITITGLRAGGLYAERHDMVVRDSNRRLDCRDQGFRLADQMVGRREQDKGFRINLDRRKGCERGGRSGVAAFGLKNHRRRFDA